MACYPLYFEKTWQLSGEVHTPYHTYGLLFLSFQARTGRHTPYHTYGLLPLSFKARTGRHTPYHTYGLLSLVLREVSTMHYVRGVAAFI